MTTHKLRHSRASHMLAAKIHPKVVQERLGHSSIAITMDIYSHLTPNMQGEAAAAVDGALRAAIKKPDDVGWQCGSRVTIRSLRRTEKLREINVWKGGRVV